MDNGTVGAVVGTTVGVLGGLAGSIFGTLGGLRNAKTAAQRRYLVRFTIVVWIVIAAFLAAMFLLGPAHWKRLWPVSLLMFVALPFMIVSCIRGCSRRERESRQGI